MDRCFQGSAYHITFQRSLHLFLIWLLSNAEVALFKCFCSSRANKPNTITKSSCKNPTLAWGNGFSPDRGGNAERWGSEGPSRKMYGCCPPASPTGWTGDTPLCPQCPESHLRRGVGRVVCRAGVFLGNLGGSGGHGVISS